MRWEAGIHQYFTAHSRDGVVRLAHGNVLAIPAKATETQNNSLLRLPAKAKTSASSPVYEMNWTASPVFHGLWLRQKLEEILYEQMPIRFERGHPGTAASGEGGESTGDAAIE